MSVEAISWALNLAPVPLPPSAKLWITASSGCSRWTPSRERGATNAPTGCNRRGDGVQRLHRNHGTIREPSAASARGCAALPAADGPSSRLAGMFFCALGPVWRLTGLPPGRAW